MLKRYKFENPMLEKKSGRIGSSRVNSTSVGTVRVKSARIGSLKYFIVLEHWDSREFQHVKISGFSIILKTLNNILEFVHKFKTRVLKFLDILIFTGQFRLDSKFSSFYISIKYKLTTTFFDI